MDTSTMDTTNLTTYICRDGYACEDIEISATTPEEAAREYVAGGDYLQGGRRTVWVAVYVCEADADGDDYERVTVEIHPPAPCAEHDWQSPAWLGGCADNPGVQGHGGGVIIREVCALTGWYRVTDTWASHPETGEQGLTSIEYREPDEKSEEWVASLESDED